MIDSKIKSNEPLISVIVLNYNGKEYLEDCLISLLNQTFQDFDIIVVDNASSDNSVEITRNRFPNVKLIINPLNEGTSGYNLGIQASTSPYVMVLNNDTVVHIQCLEEIAKNIERNNKVGMFAVKVLIYDEPGTYDSAGIAIFRDGTSKQNRGLTKDNPKEHEPVPVLLPSGAAAVYKREMLDEIGLFDPIFFTYCEETDLGLRGRLAGYECLYIPTAKVTHHVSGFWQSFPYKKALLVERNRFWLTIRTFPFRYLVLTPLYTIYRYFIQLKAALKGVGPTGQFYSENNILRILKFFIELFWISLKGAPYAIRMRRKIMSLKKISSSQFGMLLKKYRINPEEIFLNPYETDVKKS